MKNAGRGLLMMCCVAGLLTACGEDEAAKTIPVVTTLEALEVSTTAATLGGVIEATGHAKITESGFVYSNIIETPTLAANKKTVTAVEGELTTVLSGLNSGTTYHVRAYATNSEGTGYGDVIHFTTTNAAPTAKNITITVVDELKPGHGLTASYDYFDAEGDAEGSTVIQWYRADNGIGAGEVPIDGANSLNYTMQEADGEKYLRVGITTTAATGTTEGAEAKSAFTGEVGGATTVTFTYNNQEVTYGILISPVTGRKWMDRNLGAANTPTAYDDFANFGDLFQWGRLDDGHQLVTRSGPLNENVSGSATIGPPGGAPNPSYSTGDVPGHSYFIVVGVSPGDWRSPQNHNLWQGNNAINNPCPEGWHIPSKQEWINEGLTVPTRLVQEAYTNLKFTLTGERLPYAADNTFDQQFAGSDRLGSYWTSSTTEIGAYLIKITSNSSIFQTGDFDAVRATGAACRCIMN